VYQERTNRGGGLVIVAVLIFIGIGVWWLESRFGTTMTGYVLLGLGIAGAIVIGWILALATMKTTLTSQTQFSRDDAMIDRYRQMTYREHARADTAWHKANAQLTVMDAKRVDQLAQQRANLLMDLERQRHEGQAQQIPQWAIDDDDNGQFQTWE